MGLFSKKQPEIGDPIFTDMRIAEEQLPTELRQYLDEQIWFMGYPDKLSEWAVSTLGIDDDPKVQIMPQEGQRSDVKRGKTVRPILIPSDLLRALATNEDPHNLVFEFKEWERTRCNVTGQHCFQFLPLVTFSLQNRKNIIKNCCNNTPFIKLKAFSLEINKK